MTAEAFDKHPAGLPSKNLGIELTTRCNSPCLHCFARAGLAAEASLAPECVKEICAEGYASGYRHLHLTGGEPLLWQGLFELLEHVFEIGYQSVFLNSNGTLFTKDVIKRLARYRPLAISVSLQGEAAQHDRMRGPGAHRQAARGILAALEADLAVTVFTAVGQSLLGELVPFAARLFKDFTGIKRLTLIRMIRVREDIYDLSQELLDPEDFLRLVRTVAGLNLYGLETDVLNDPLVNVAAKLLQMPWIPPSQPLHRPGRLIIRANRDITLAHSTWERYGRYQPGMIERILTSRRYRQAVTADEKICPSCQFLNHCRPNGMIRPSDASLEGLPGTLYCQRVLALATTR